MIQLGNSTVPNYSTFTFTSIIVNPTVILYIFALLNTIPFLYFHFFSPHRIHNSTLFLFCALDTAYTNYSTIKEHIIALHYLSVYNQDVPFANIYRFVEYALYIRCNLFEFWRTVRKWL